MVLLAVMATPAAAQVPTAQSVLRAVAVNLYNNIQAYKLNVTTIAPIHGRATPWGDFLRFVGETE